MTTQRVKVALDLGGGSAPILLGECLWVPSKKVAAFQWGKEAIESGFDLAPLNMPLRPGVWTGRPDLFGGLPGMLNDSLPDGFGLRLMNQSLANQSLASLGHPLDEITPLHRLAWVGRRGVGALIFEPEINAGKEADLFNITQLGEQAQRAQAGNFVDIPKSAIAAGGSAQGARPKFWALLKDDGKSAIVGNYEKTPTGFTACLIKFPPSGGDKNEPFYEAACLELAAEHGILASKGRLLEHSSGAALAVERFDRSFPNERIFSQSLSALLHHNFREPSLDYLQLAQVANKLAGPSQNEPIYRLACFNVALSLRDDHSKNFSFIMDKQRVWNLAPAYDLCPNDGPNGWHTMSINGQAENPSKSDLLAFAAKLNLSPEIAKAGIEAALSAASDFKSRAIGLGAEKAAAGRWAVKINQNSAALRDVKVAVPKRKLLEI